MRFHKQTVDADRDRGPRQHRHELALAAGLAAGRAGQLHRMRGIEHHRAAARFQDFQAAHVDHQVVVAERSAALAHQHLRIGAGGRGLVDHMAHLVRRQELAFLDVDRAAGLRRGFDEVGLAAQEGRGLQYIDGLRRSFDIVHRMHIGEHRQVEFAAHFGENFQTAPAAGAARRVRGSTVGFVERRFINQVDAEVDGDFAQPFGGRQRQRLGLDDARAGDEKKRRAAAGDGGVKVGEVHAAAACRAARWFNAALM